MQKTAIRAGLFLCALVFLGTTQVQTASASTVSTSKLATASAFEYRSLAVETVREPGAETKLVGKPATLPSEKVPTQHIVAEGESLTMVAEKHGSTWLRLFAKNTHIADPNVIKVGETVTIPEPGEQLAERPLPAPQPQPVAVSAQPAGQASVGYNGGDSAGNTYYAGYCTWYAKNRRPDLPNSLGNADTWVYRAQAMGIATGAAPRVGAIGQQGMHVVYVESVNGDGTVTISEMNYQGLYAISSRTVAAGNFTYIY